MTKRDRLDELRGVAEQVGGTVRPGRNTPRIYLPNRRFVMCPARRSVDDIRTECEELGALPDARWRRKW